MPTFFIFLKVLFINIIATIFFAIVISNYYGGQLFGMNMAVFAILLLLPTIMLVFNAVMFALAKFQYLQVTETYIYGAFCFFWGIIAISIFSK